MNLLLAVPSCRDWKPAFGSSLVGLVAYAAKLNLRFTPHIMQGASNLPRARNLAVRKAIKEGLTHILFIDDDMTFSFEVLDHLLRHDVDVVGVNYTTKSPDLRPQTHDLNGLPVYSQNATGLEEVGWLGCGMMLIKLESVKDLPDPLFEMRWVPERNDFIGEDYFFCGTMRHHGRKIYVDHDASAKVGHVGDYVYKEPESLIFGIEEPE